MNSSLRIGLISYRSNPHCGGQGVYIRHLSQALSDLGHDVEVIAGPPDPIINNKVKLTMLETLDLYNPEDLFRTPSLNELKNPINLIEWLDISTLGFPEPLTFGMRVKQHLKKTKKEYDIIHDNQSLSYSILSLARRMPVTTALKSLMPASRFISLRQTISVTTHVKTQVIVSLAASMPKKYIAAARAGTMAMITSSMMRCTDAPEWACGDELTR